MPSATLPDTADKKSKKTLNDEVFAECDTRQRSLGKLYISNSLNAKYFLSGICHTRI